MYDIWIDRNGKEYNIKEMSTSHLMNTIQMLKRSTIQHIPDYDMYIDYMTDIENYIDVMEEELESRDIYQELLDIERVEKI